MDKRTILAIVLSLILVMGYQYFFQKPNEAQKATEQAATATAPVAAGGTDKPAESTQQIASYRHVIVEKLSETVAEENITVESPLFIATFSTRGGALKSFKLKNYKKEVGTSADLIELVDVKETTDYPLSFALPDSTVTVPFNLSYRTDKSMVNLASSDKPQDLTFTKKVSDDFEIRKTYTFYPGKYAFDLSVEVVNGSADAWQEKAVLTWTQYVDPAMEKGKYSHEGPAYSIGNTFETVEEKKMEARKLYGPNIYWAGYETKYFISSLIPAQPSLTNLVLAKNGDNSIKIDLEGQNTVILPGQRGIFRYRIYLGPKDYDILKAENAGLENSINFGSWIKWLALPLLVVLKTIYQYVPNYGMAIIILTILIKMIFWPLGNMSYRSMKKMQQLQPQMQQLRDKYKNDKARLNQEVMGLYKTHKVNPMGGCIPIVVQLPVFFGLYRSLLYSIDLRHAPFLLWIQDLSAKDPYYITPIIMGATMFIQQKMTPTPGGNEMQAKLMLWMPVIFTFMFLSFPSGLVLYWLFNNILSIGQQYFINKRSA
ncbi:MAG: membrane protein insertase YidC [Deltaproteobacteria bacterium]|nr:membrane protein insertase YidC [Deltaproteobacteria bacterium]